MLPNSEGSTQRGQVHVKCLHTQDDQQATSSSQYQVTSFLFLLIINEKQCAPSFLQVRHSLIASQLRRRVPRPDLQKNRFLLLWSLWIISLSWNIFLLLWSLWKYISTSLITLIKMIINTCSPSLIGDCAISSRRWSSLCFLVCVLQTQLGGDRCHHFQRWCRWRNYKLRGLMILDFDCVWIWYCQCNWFKQYDGLMIVCLLFLNLWLAYV